MRPSLKRYEPHQVSDIGVKYLNAIGKRNEYYAIVPSEVPKEWVSVKITRANYLAIRRAWQGSTCIGETGLACWLHARDYHQAQAMMLQTNQDTYAAWQAHNARLWLEGKDGVNYYDWQPAPLAMA